MVPNEVSLGQPCSDYCVVEAASAKFNLHAGNVKFSIGNAS